MAGEQEKRRALSPLENAVMQVVWDGQPITAEEVRGRMAATHELKASTIRTLLRRLEGKGYLSHEVEGRTYVYRATLEQANVATSAVRSIVDKFCSGSVESLLVGLVDDEMISPQRLQELADQIAAAEQPKKKKSQRTKRR